MDSGTAQVGRINTTQTSSSRLLNIIMLYSQFNDIHDGSEQGPSTFTGECAKPVNGKCARLANFLP